MQHSRVTTDEESIVTRAVPQSRGRQAGGPRLLIPARRSRTSVPTTAPVTGTVQEVASQAQLLEGGQVGDRPEVVQHRPGRPAHVAPPGKAVTSIRRIGRWLGNLVVLVAIAAFLGLAVGPHTGAYRTTTMLTGSMRPLYPPGSLLLLTPQSAAELSVGQVITFNAPIGDKRVVTHRIVSVDHSGPRPVMVTKGDANNGNDPWAATVSGDTVWPVRGAVPYLGSAIQRLREPHVQLALTRGLPALLLLSLLVSVWRPERR